MTNVSMRASMWLLIPVALAVAAPAAAQKCVADPPARLAEKVMSARQFPRAMTPAQVTELRQLLPVMRATPAKGAPALRAWVVKGGFTAGEMCPLVYALIRAVQTQTVPDGSTPASGGAGGAASAAVSGGAANQASATDVSSVQAEIDALNAEIAGLQKDLDALMAELVATNQMLKDAIAAKPPQPDKSASAEQMDAFKKNTASWQSEVTQLQKQIDELARQIKIKQAQIDALRAQIEAEQKQAALATTVEQTVGSAVK